MSCTVPANQPIYQALLDKAASYPADKPYQAKAYKKAAESVLTYEVNIYSEYAKWNSLYSLPANIGEKIEDFIYEFIKANPAPAPLTGAARAMDDARKAAAANAPKDVTTWPKDDDRAAFQARLAASKVIDTPTVQEAIAQLRTALNLPPKPIEQAKPKAWETYWANYQESLKPVVYTAENPRRSKRNINKPKVQYFTKEDEQDEIAETIEAVCVKKGWAYSDELVTEFEAWLPTADKYSLEKYDYNTGKYIPRTKPDVAKYWAQYYSTSLQKQQKEQKLSKGLIKYCEKNNIEYQDLMADKFAAWMADPANKKLITKTYKSSSGCNCGACNPTGALRTKNEYSYELGPTACINKWFSTLKKTIIW
jgi:hypothetical protein